ncbi:alpha/beta fold hydrolase [Paenochrobactrum pullorum]|uniref:alpha/beta fold hydrolase n=1 Tax=Paenochrobactrum pullorum TaxID=1324351 RepID=UPI0035BC649D
MNSLKLADNRQLVWHEWGALDGRVVIFCPGAGMAGRFVFGERDAEELNLRMISVDRAGLGGSDADPQKTLASWTQDIEQLLNHLEAEAPLAIGFSQGAVFAYALAAVNLVEALTIVSGQDELSHPAVIKQLPDSVAVMVERANSDKLALETEIAQFATAEWLWQMIETMSAEQDRAYYAQGDFAPHYRVALDAGFVQGAAGYARDTILAMAPWPFKLEEINCPVQLWYGLADTSPVHSPDFGETLSKRLPCVKLNQIESSGSAVLWTQSREILMQLAAGKY